MKRTRVPTVKPKKTKWFRFVTKPTTDAFCRGKRCTSKTIPEDYLKLEVLVAERDPDIERYFFEEISA